MVLKAGHFRSGFLSLLAEVLFREDTGGQEGINSSELFLNKIDTRILNSNGVDIDYRSYEGYCELIVDGKGARGDVELHKELSFSDFRPERLSDEVRKRQRKMCTTGSPK